MKKQKEQGGIDQRRAYYWGRVRKYCEQYKGFNWPSTELILNLVYAHDVLLSYSTKTLEAFNLSISAMNVLMILYFGGARGYKQQELSGLLLVSRANVTKVIDGLEKRGLVVRNASREDRRARFIKLTDAGRALTDQIIPVQNKKSVFVASVLAKNEIGLLNKLLAKLSAHIIENGKIR